MNLKMYRGDTAQFRVTALDIDGNPLDISGASAWFTAKRATTEADNTAVFQKTVGDGITITDALNGIMLVQLAEADTNTLTKKEVLEYDLQVKDVLNGIYTVARGSLTVEADVTRAST